MRGGEARVACGQRHAAFTCGWMRGPVAADVRAGAGRVRSAARGLHLRADVLRWFSVLKDWFTFVRMAKAGFGVLLSGLFQ